SNAFAVKPGPTSLYIPTPLATTAAGQPLGTITVQVLEVNGSVSGAATGTVTLFLDKNPGGAQFVDASGKQTVLPPVPVGQGGAQGRTVQLTAGAGASHFFQLGGTNPPSAVTTNGVARFPGDDGQKFVYFDAPGAYQLTAADPKGVLKASSPVAVTVQPTLTS